jgi:hypothetical protein
MPLPEHTPTLDARGLLLRAFDARDVEGRRVLGEDPEIVRMFGGTPDFAERREMTRERAAAWFRQVSSDHNPLHWAIDLDGRFVGPPGRAHLARRRDHGHPRPRARRGGRRCTSRCPMNR